MRRPTFHRPGGRAAVVAAACALGVTSLVVAAGQVSAAPTRSAGTSVTAGYQPPKIGHVWTIMLENKSYESTFTGLNENDYLWKTLPSYGLLLDGSLDS